MRKIIVVGMAGPYELPLLDHEEIWGVNRCYQHQYNLSRLYFLDHLKAFEPEFIQDVNNLDITVYCQSIYPRINKSKSYPLKDIKAEFPLGYFTSSIAYMIAHAIKEEVDHIHLHKILPPSLHGDYEDQKPCLEMWMGIASGRGIEVTTSDSSIGIPFPWQTGLYGFQNALPFAKTLYLAGFRPEVK